MLFRRLARPGDDDGFTLLESVVALTVAAVVFTALGAALISSMHSVMIGRTNQQAADAGARAMEDARQLTYSELAVLESSLENEPAGLTASRKYQPEQHTAGGAGSENLVVDPAGKIDHHESVTVGNAPYEIYTYVTTPADATGKATYKRVTVVTKWTVRGVERTRSASTFVSEKVSGLPLPDYKFTPASATNDCANPGATLAYTFNLRNNGARDSWTVTETDSVFDWTFSSDTAGADVIGTSDAPPVLGPIDPTGSRTFTATALVPSDQSAVVDTHKFTVTSVATPTSSASLEVVSTVKATGSACEVVVTPTVTPTETETASPTETAVPPSPPPQPAASTDCAATTPSASTSNSSTLRAYYFQNAADNVTNTTAAEVLGMAKLTLPVSTTLWNYSTDLHTDVAGRALSPTGTTAATKADWRYQFTGSTKLTGNGAVKVWAAPASGTAATPLSFTVKVLRLSSTGTVLQTLGTATVGTGAWGCAGYKPFGTTVAFGSGNGTSFSANDYLAVQVSVTGGSAVLAYDMTRYPSAIVLPVKSGG